MMANFFAKIYESPRVVRIGCFVFAGLILCWQLLFTETEHAHTWVEEHIPAWWTLFTLLSCVLLVFVAKIYSYLARRGDDYYDK